MPVLVHSLALQNTYITLFNIDGTVLMDETEIPGASKFEGLEVWPID